MKSIIPHGSSCNGENWVVRTVRGDLLGREVRVASGFASRLRGLLGTRSLPDGHGLLLVPCRSIHMLFMSYPLDVAFLDEAGTVVAAVRMKPWSVSRMYPEAFAVLELPAGTLEKFDLKKGDRLVFEKSTG